MSVIFHNCEAKNDVHVLFFSFLQGLPGFVGPPGQMGIAGTKVKNVFNLSLFTRITISCCCAWSFVIL